MRKVIFATLITIVLVGAVLLIERNLRLGHDTAQISGAGKTLPTDAGFIDFTSKKRTTFKSFEGKVVLVNFWASWCEACMAEMPSIQKLYDTLKSEGLVVVAINVDDHPEKVVPRILEKLHLTFPIYTENDGEMSKAFDVVAIPFSVLADRQQKTVWAESGERDWSSETVIGEIRKLLKPI